MDWRVALVRGRLRCRLVACRRPGARAQRLRHSARSRTLRRRGRQDRAHGSDGAPALLVAQTALCVALLVSGGLLVRAYIRTSRLALGYEPSGVLTAQLQLPPSRYANGPERVAAMERIFEPHRRNSRRHPFRRDDEPLHCRASRYLTLVDIENQPTPTAPATLCSSAASAPDYFATLRIRLRAGPGVRTR